MSFSYNWASDGFCYDEKPCSKIKTKKNKKKEKLVNSSFSEAITSANKKLNLMSPKNKALKCESSVTVESLLCKVLDKTNSKSTDSPNTPKKSALKSSKKAKNLSVSFASESLSNNDVAILPKSKKNAPMNGAGPKKQKTSKSNDGGISAKKLNINVPIQKVSKEETAKQRSKKQPSKEDKALSIAAVSHNKVISIMENEKTAAQKDSNKLTQDLSDSKSKATTSKDTASTSQNLNNNLKKKRKVDELHTNNSIPTVSKKKKIDDDSPAVTNNGCLQTKKSIKNKKKESLLLTAKETSDDTKDNSDDEWNELVADMDLENVDDSDAEIDHDEEEPELDEKFHSDLKSLLKELNFGAANKVSVSNNTDNDESDKDSNESVESSGEEAFSEDHSENEEEESMHDNKSKAPSLSPSDKKTESAKTQKPSVLPSNIDGQKIGALLAKFGSTGSQQPSSLLNSRAQSLADKMTLKLNVAKFRMINEKLYKTTGREAKAYFKEDPDSFKIYHDGFKAQVAHWPLNPIDNMVEWLNTQNKSWVVADFGCGEGELAERVQQKVHSLDLVAVKPHITVCDMARTPLKSQSINVAIFCLSLMGTNVSDFIKEANRTLRPGGVLKIAEVESRITNPEEFVANIHKFGFKCHKQPVNHNYFVSFDFKKIKDVKNRENLPSITMKPCVYKKR